MGRKKLLMKKIDSPASLQTTYSKRRDGIVKKATELSVLCDADVGVLMFSPHGRLTSFSSNGRIEDIFLRILDQPTELKEGTVEDVEKLCQRLTHLKCEREMLEKIAKSYNPVMKHITSIREISVHKQVLTGAIQRLDQLEAKLRCEQTYALQSESIEVPAADINDLCSTSDEFMDSDKNRETLDDEDGHEENFEPVVGPHLSLGFLRKQKHWNLQNGEHAIRLEGS